MSVLDKNMSTFLDKGHFRVNNIHCLLVDCIQNYRLCILILTTLRPELRIGNWRNNRKKAEIYIDYYLL